MKRLFKSSKADHRFTGASTDSSAVSQGERVIPSRRPEEFSPPPGPPPGHTTTSSQNQDYQPPPFPPPSHSGSAVHHDIDSDFEPPPFPPPSHKPDNAQQENLPPYHDWTVIPDTSLLPPPPSIGFEFSPTGNTTRDDADRAHAWCDHNPLWAPSTPSEQVYNAVRSGDIRLIKPREYNGHLTMSARGRWRGSTRAGAKDSILLTSLPLYFAMVDSPLLSRTSKIIYFEVGIISLGRGRGNGESGAAIGFAAQPYPPWRMPGWERGSLGVHSDDGRRYVNDTWGGKDFTTPLKEGETIGLGMSFLPPQNPLEYGKQRRSLGIEVFMTRNGKRQSQWDLHEERDSERDGDIEGMAGDFDLYGAIGVFGGVEFEACFDAGGWQYQPGSSNT